MIFVVQTNDSNDSLERLRREQLLQSHVPHLGHFLERSHLVQPRNDRPRIIQRVRASELFREAILIARQLQNRAARAHAPSLRRRGRSRLAGTGRGAEALRVLSAQRVADALSD